MTLVSASRAKKRTIAPRIRKIHFQSQSMKRPMTLAAKYCSTFEGRARKFMMALCLNAFAKGR